MTIIKAVVICLALANLGYFLWARGVEPAEPVTGSATVDTLRLASEPGNPPRPAPSAAADGAAATPTAGTAGVPTMAATGRAATQPSPARRCIAVGPFRDVSEAAHAATTLRGGGYDPRQRVADGEVWTGVWVYVPVPASRGAAEQILGKLKSGGIDDALQMPGPNDAAVISLGLYLEPKRAQARVAQAQALGFNPGISDRKRTGNVYWIDIDLKPTDPVLNPGDLQTDAARGARLEVKPCPTGPSV